VLGQAIDPCGEQFTLNGDVAFPGEGESDAVR